MLVFIPHHTHKYKRPEEMVLSEKQLYRITNAISGEMELFDTDSRITIAVRLSGESPLKADKTILLDENMDLHIYADFITKGFAFNTIEVVGVDVMNSCNYAYNREASAIFNILHAKAIGLNRKQYYSLINEIL